MEWPAAVRISGGSTTYTRPGDASIGGGILWDNGTVGRLKHDDIFDELTKGKLKEKVKKSDRVKRMVKCSS